MSEAMKPQPFKRSIAIAGRKTSVNLEDASWYALRRIASDRGITIGDLVATIDAERQHGNLSSAIRLFVRGCYRKPIKANRRLLGLSGKRPQSPETLPP